jgi:hypothetical protein
MANLRLSVASAVLLAVATTIAPALDAKDKLSKARPPESTDAIEVAGHIPLTDGTVARFFTTQHFSSYYLYAERDGGRGVALIDVTDAGRPSVLGDVPYPASASGNLAAVAGTAALVTTGPMSPASTPAPQTIRIMDFSDTHNPRIAREFTGVTAMSRDDRRGLIFIANTDGIWILKQQLAHDPQVEKDYANYVLYSH